MDSSSPGTHTMTATAQYPVAQFSKTTSSTFTVASDAGVTNYYDGAGYVTNRAFKGGKTQGLKWDAAGRLVKVIQRDNPTNGFDWAAIYDSLGRRLRTVQTNVVNGAYSMIQTNDSFFDPQVEFGEIGVALNGARTWKVVGPDANGKLGSMYGVGSIENFVTQTGGTNYPVASDYFGHVVATVTNYGATIGYGLFWNPTRVTGYGPVPGYAAPVFGNGTPLATASLWRSKRIDPTGFYWLGARNYDPVGGRFMSPDPMGFGGSTWDLYSFADNDPNNRFDPDGRLGKEFYQGLNLSPYVNQLKTGSAMLDYLANNTGSSWVGGIADFEKSLLDMPLNSGSVAGYVNRTLADYDAGGPLNVANRYNPMLSPYQAFSSMNLMEGEGFGEPRGTMNRTVDWLNTVALASGTAAFMMRPGIPTTFGDVPPVISEFAKDTTLAQTYQVGAGTSRSDILQLNRNLYDQFIASGGTFNRMRDVYRINPDTGNSIWGTYNSVENSINLYRGSDLSTISEELIHWSQVQRAGLVGQPIPAAIGPVFEQRAATTLLQWGYKPTP